MNKVLSDDCLGAKLRVTENRCVLFDSFTYIYKALLPQRWALYTKVDSTPTFIIYIYIYIYIYHICVHCILPLLTKAVWSRHVRQCVQFTPVSPKMYFQIISIHILHIKTVVSTGIFLKKMCQWHLHNLSKSKQSNC